MNEKITNQSNKLIFIMWFSVAIFYIYQYVARSCVPNLLATEFMKYFKTDAVGVSKFSVAYYFAYAFAQIPTGILLDKIGVKKVCSLAAAVCSTGMFIFVSTNNYNVAILGQILIGFSSAFALISMFKIITVWFPQNLISIFTAITLSIGVAGPIVCGPLIANLLENTHWQTVLLYFSFFGFLTSCAIFICIKEKKESLICEDTQNKTCICTQIFSLIKNKDVLIFAFYSMCLYAPISVLADLWGTSFIKSLYCVDSVVANSASNMMYIGLAIGAPIFATIANRIKSYKKPMIFAAIFITITFFVIIFVKGLNIEYMFILIFIVGILSGGVLTFQAVFEIVPKSITGTASAFINMGSMISGVLLQPLVSYIIHHSWSGLLNAGIPVYSSDDYRNGFIAVLIFLFLAVISSFMMKETYKTN